MDLSIVIVNWNSADLLRQALTAVFSQVRGLAYEVIVIDSGSFDGSARMLRGEFPTVGFIQSPDNIGFARANNQASVQCTGRTILFLNPDTEVRGDAVLRLHDALAADGRAAVAGPRLLNSDGSIQETCIRALPTLLNQLLDSDVLRSMFPRSWLWGKQPLSGRDSGASAVPVEAISGACLMIRRSVFEKVGGFSTDYFMYSEDMDLCLKVARAGYLRLFVPAAEVVHHGGSSSEQANVSNFAAVMRVESQWRFFRKTRSPLYAAAYRAAICAASVVRLIALTALRGTRHGTEARACSQSSRKWMARLRWTLGAERWVRDY